MYVLSETHINEKYHQHLPVIMYVPKEPHLDDKYKKDLYESYDKYVREQFDLMVAKQTRETELYNKQLDQIAECFKLMQEHFKAGRLIEAVDIASSCDNSLVYKLFASGRHRDAIDVKDGELHFNTLYSMSYWDWKYINSRYDMNTIYAHYGKIIENIKDIIFGHNKIYYDAELNYLMDTDNTSAIESLKAAREEHQDMKAKKRMDNINYMKSEKTWDEANTILMSEVESCLPAREVKGDDRDDKRLWLMKLETFYHNVQDILSNRKSLQHLYNQSK